MKQKLLFALLALVVGWTNANAQTDVTSTYLTNAGFDACTAETSDVAAKTKKDYSSNGWTNANSGDYTTIAVTAYGGGVKLATSTTPTTKKDGSTVSGNTLGIIAGWGDNVIIKSNDITLPAGAYTITVDHYLTSSTTNYNSSSSKFGFVTSSNSYLVSSTTFTASTWTTETVTFNLTEPTTGKIQIGLTGTNTSGSNTPAVFYDDVTITWTDPLDAAKAALMARIEYATNLNASELATAIAAAQSVYDNATTEAELTTALTELNDAILRYENGLMNASATNPVVTNFVVNGTFDSNFTPWQHVAEVWSNKLASNKTGDFTGNFYENWDGAAKVNKMYQTINNIPNGTYKLKIAAFMNTLADPNDSQYVFANSDKTYLTSTEPIFYEVWTVVTGNTVEVGLEQTTATANWMGIDNVSLTYYGAGDVISQAQAGAHKTNWDQALADAQAAIANTDYANVTGKEKADLEAEIAKTEPTTADGYDAATAALTTATNAFTTAKTNYDLFATYNTDLAYADPAKKPTITNTTTAATLITALRAYFESNALAEGVSGAVNKTASISNPDAEDGNNGWTWTGNKNDPANNEPWTDASGNSTHRYFDGGNWNGSNWTTTMKQTITLPAGRYLLTAKGRAATNTTLTMSVGTVSVELPHVGSTGNVFDRGWGDGTIEFETTGSSFEINVTATASPTHEWFSIGDFRLMQLSVNSSALADEWDNLKAEVSPYLTNTDYANVIGVERTNVNTALGATPSTDAEYTAAIEALTSAKNAFVAAKPNYDALVAEIAYAKTIGVATATADGFAATSESTATSVVTNMNNLKVAEYTHITGTYTEAATLSTWTEDFAEDLNGEGYVDNGPTYWNEWGTNTRTAKQTVSLPAGDYAIACIARGQVGTSGHMYYKIGTDETTVDFIMKGNRGRGVDTSKDANFSDGGTYTCNNEGFGWEYRYLTFTLAQQTDVEIGVSATFAGQWVSIYAPELLTTETSLKALRLAEIAEAINNVPTGNMYSVVRTTLNDKKAAAEAASTSNTKDELTTILNELNDAIAAATASIAEYDEISDYLTTSQTNVAGDYTSINTAITNGDYEHEADGIAAVKAIRNSIATNNMAANTDLTVLIDNNDFELGDTKYWTVVNSSDTGVRETTNDTYRMSNSHGNYLFNTWWQGTPITQNIGKLPAGAYEMKGVVASDGGTIYITMNDSHEAFVETAGAKSGSSIAPAKVGIEFSYVFTLDAETDVTIGIVGGADGTAGSHKAYQDGGYWFYKADNFRLTYLGATAPDNMLDGTYYFEMSGNKINRGGDSDTEAVMNTDGIPMIITTDKAGISTIKFSDTGKYMMFNDEMVYTDGTIDPKSVYHKPYWKIEPVTGGGYQILNTESGLYLATTTATRNSTEVTVATLSETAAVWTLTSVVFATDPELQDLATAVAAMPALGFEAGECAPYNNVASITTAAEEIAKVDAEKAAFEGKALQSTVLAATNAISNLTWTTNTDEVNAFYDGTFALAANNGAPAGWRMSNNTLGGDYHSRAFVGDDRLAEFNTTKSGLYLRFDGTNSSRGSMYYYGDTQGYTMPLKANTTYCVKVDFAGWGSTGKPLRMNVTGPTGFTAVNQQYNTSVRADNADDAPQQFVIYFTTGDAGDYVVNFQTPGADTNTHGVVISNCELFKAQPASITIKANRQYTGFSCDTPLDFEGTGLKAYIVTSATGTTAEVTKVPANTGVIVGLDAVTATAQNINVPACASNATDDVTGNMLVPVLTATTIQQEDGSNTNYVFGKGNGKEQFFKVRSEGMEVPANNVYLAVPTNTAKGLDVIGFGGDATSINALETETVNGNIYNLQGQKMNRAQKGIYIVNGRKVVVK